MLLTSHDVLLPVVAVSACWLSEQHADPHGHNLRAIGAALEEQSRLYRARAADGGPGFAEVGVFWDVRPHTQYQRSRLLGILLRPCTVSCS